MFNRTVAAAVFAACGALVAAPAATAQSVDFYLDECSGLAQQYFGVHNVRTAMRYNGARVDGTETAGGEIFLPSRTAYVACAWPAGDYMISEFFVDGRDHTDFFRPSNSGAPADVPRPPSVGGTDTVRVSFPAGSTGTELTGSVAPGGSVRYVLGAQNGQFLYARVAPRSGHLEYEIFNPDGSFLLELISASQEYRGQLWQSGDHVVEVVNRGGQTLEFNVIFGIE